MPYGLPSTPPPDIDFTPSLDDETCPECGWDREDAAQDYQMAYNAQMLLAIEMADSSPYSAMAGTTLMAFYWACPSCGNYFTTEEENSSIGAMS